MSAETMTPARAAEILERHNRWRKGDKDIPQGDPFLIGLAIDVAVTALKTEQPKAEPPHPAGTWWPKLPPAIQARCVVCGDSHGGLLCPKLAVPCSAAPEPKS